VLVLVLVLVLMVVVVVVVLLLLLLLHRVVQTGIFKTVKLLFKDSVDTEVSAPRSPGLVVDGADMHR
jgi:hypothetical protein